MNHYNFLSNLKRNVYLCKFVAGYNVETSRYSVLRQLIKAEITFEDASKISGVKVTRRRSANVN